MMRNLNLASLAGIVWAVGVSVPANADLDADSDQLFRQGAGGVSGSTEAWDQFGWALAVGDFDGDGYEDLAIGVLGENNGAGAVNVLYGDSFGLSAIGNQFWNQDSAGVVGIPELGDQFGWALTAGDFDGDGYDDLAIGVPGEDYLTADDDGAVHVLYGGAGGLTATGSQFWSQGSPGITCCAPEEDDWFGEALTAGDFDGDGYEDLAIGVRGEDLGNLVSAGAVNVLYGGAGGLTATGNQFWNQGSAGVVGIPEMGDQFGWALTAGDFDGDGYDDLVIGVPHEDYLTDLNDGGVHVLYGGAGGLTATDNQFWSQDSAGVAETAEENDYFGYALAAGDFDGDGADDLAVGVPLEDFNATNDGGVHVLYGGPNGVSAGGNQFWSQDSGGVVGAAETSDHFGLALAAGDFDGDGYDDVAVGVPGEDFQTPADDGGVHVLYSGGLRGIQPAGNQFWSQDSAGMDLDTAEEGDEFGWPIIAGDFNGNGAHDLAVGVPVEDWELLVNSGIVQVLYDSSVIFANGFEPGDTSVWSSPVP